MYPGRRGVSLSWKHVSSFPAPRTLTDWMTRLILIAMLALVFGGVAYGAEPTPTLSPSSAETAPVASSGDAADDPTIWVNDVDPARSRIIANDKKGALNMYRLDGSLVTSLYTGTFWGNSDVRGNLLAVARSGIKLYDVTEKSLDRIGSITTSGEGLCMYQSPTDLYVFTVTRRGLVRQFKLNASGGGTLVRSFSISSEAEGCAVDDEARALYISQEDVALWRYGANPSDGTARVAVDTLAPGGRLTPDAEGVAITGNRVIVSSQYGKARSKSYFTAYTRDTNDYVGAFRIGNGSSSDDCDGTDGIAAYQGYLGLSYPFGLFVCQDGTNGIPGSSGNQNFKLAPWDALP
jgi:myo-inositol-hexaphosphate 3-phosphohydrolase